MLKILSNSALQWKVLTDKILKCFLGWPQLNKSSENKWPVLTGTIITTIFKPLQTIDQKCGDLLSALGSAIVEVCKNPAHFDPMLFSKRSNGKLGIFYNVASSRDFSSVLSSLITYYQNIELEIRKNSYKKELYLVIVVCTNPNKTLKFRDGNFSIYMQNIWH